MLKVRNNHDATTDPINGKLIDGLYTSGGGAIFTTARGKGKAHLAAIGSYHTVCSRGTGNMGSTHSLTSHSNPVDLCKTCHDAARRLDLRLIRGGWYELPLIARLNSSEILKDGPNRLLSLKGLNPFHMTPEMRNPYVRALVSGDRLPQVDVKAHLHRKSQLTTLDELHDTALIDLVDAAAKSNKIRFEFMRFYRVTASYDNTSTLNGLPRALELAASFLGYHSLEVGVLFMKARNKIDLSHTIAFNVHSDEGAGVISLSGVPYNQKIGGKSSEFDREMGEFTALVKGKIGSRQKWAI